jgi:hypothetical protein
MQRGNVRVIKLTKIKERDLGKSRGCFAVTNNRNKVSATRGLGKQDDYKANFPSQHSYSSLKEK